MLLREKTVQSSSGVPCTSKKNTNYKNVVVRCDSVMGDRIGGAVMHPKDTTSGR